MPSREDAKNAIDKLIKIARVHMYKPTQIAEILYHDRVVEPIDFNDLESYRNTSKDWRNDVSKKLVGRKCGSCSVYQDNLFDDNAIPPKILNVLGEENRCTHGAVEAYIYKRIMSRLSMLSVVYNHCITSDKNTFKLKDLIDSFDGEPGLKRSIDKIYEICAYALFSTLVEAMELRTEVSIGKVGYSLMEEFSDFSEKVLCLDSSNSTFIQEAKIYRVGETNAADRGLDMFSNWGPIIQVKHLSLDETVAENVVNEVTCDRIVIVCKDADAKVICSLLTNIGWKSHIQSIVTESDLIEWYEKALRGKYSDVLGDCLLDKICDEMVKEFPSVKDKQAENAKNFMDGRGYLKIHDDFWTWK